jgi:hypothetical protein
VGVENIFGWNHHVKIKRMCSEKIREKKSFNPHHGSILPPPRVPPFVRMVFSPHPFGMGGSGLGGRGIGRKSGNREEEKERKNRQERTFQVQHSKAKAFGGGNLRKPCQQLAGFHPRPLPDFPAPGLGSRPCAANQIEGGQRGMLEQAEIPEDFQIIPEDMQTIPAPPLAALVF